MVSDWEARSETSEVLSVDVIREIDIFLRGGLQFGELGTWSVKVARTKWRKI